MANSCTQDSERSSRLAYHDELALGVALYHCIALLQSFEEKKTSPLLYFFKRCQKAWHRNRIRHCSIGQNKRIYFRRATRCLSKDDFEKMCRNCHLIVAHKKICKEYCKIMETREDVGGWRRLPGWDPLLRSACKCGRWRPPWGWTEARYTPGRCQSVLSMSAPKIMGKYWVHPNCQ